jgi:Asp/Glu/hydantoin racemase
MGDPGVAALRSVLDVPVLGPGRTTYHAALMLGERFSVLSQWGGWNHVFRRVARDAGLEAQLASVRSPDVFPDVEHLLAGKEDEVFPQLERVARECVELDGADVVILGSTTMHQSAAYLAQRLPVPVINPGPLCYKLAESIVALGLTHSRRASAVPYEPRPELIRAMVQGGRRLNQELQDRPPA